MGKVYFLFGVHNHQPIGNFPYIFEMAFNQCYKPFMDILYDYPKIKCNLHISGPLYDWLLASEIAFLKKIKEMVKRGQLEIISGGYYEPILPIIPSKDAQEQIILMNRFIEKEFKVLPKGIWLAERVWEPQLPELIVQGELSYTFLDDTHFRYAGLSQENFFNYYITEHNLKSIKIFPISKLLRYKIPFSKPEEAVDLLKSFIQKDDVLVTLFDDGEKFGLWPYTYDWVYNKHWLDKFFTLLTENIDKIETIKAEEAIKKFPSQGLIYIPTASYEEMGEWVLSPPSAYIYQDLKEYINKNEANKNFYNFIRGGFFPNFYRKYPRLNYMHKRMYHLSKRLHNTISVKKEKKIFDFLWKSQCNCGYWHGVFGGFYLGHIRAAIYENMIKAEDSWDKKYLKKNFILEHSDFNYDGYKETLFKNKNMICVFSQQGGTLWEWSVKKIGFNLLNTLTRREESYHRKLKHNSHRPQDEPITIHNIVKTKEKHLEDYLIFDNYEKVGLLDHILHQDVSFQDVSKNKEIFSLGNHPYELRSKIYKGKVYLDYQFLGEDLTFTKRIILSSGWNWYVEYIFGKNYSLQKHRFGVEFNLFLQSPQDVKFVVKDKRYSWQEKGHPFYNTDCFIIEDNFKKINIKFLFPRADVYIIPLYSVTSSESGFERTYQQLTIFFIKLEKTDVFSLDCSLSLRKKEAKNKKVKY